MVGVGVAGCLNCGCGGTESCCIPDSFTFVWDTPSCSFDDGEVTMTKTTLDSISVNLQYKPRNGEVWIGTYLTDGMCEDDAHHVDLYIYCTSIGGIPNIVVEAFCYDSEGNLLSWALGKDPDFTCDPFSFSVTTDLGSICCSCDLGGGVTGGTEACGNCVDDIAAASWSITLSGLTNSGCSDCATFNRTWTLSYVGESGGTCRWQELFNDPVCGGVSYSANLYISSMGSVQVEFVVDGSYGNITSYFGTVGVDFDCLSGGTINSHSDMSGACTNWPSTINITAA